MLHSKTNITLTALMLIVLTAPSSAADKKAKTVTLKDVDTSRIVFSFGKGKLVTIKSGEADAFDLMLDIPHGLGTNNSKLTSKFKGSGGIVDMGKKSLGDVKKAPAKGYAPALKVAQIKTGHTYCVRTADGKKYAKIHIVKFDQKSEQLTMTWVFPIASGK